ncbi:hypothetical protein PR048_012119 [Dryococelus australis]|uniref:Uncharacterized protein n=1 Tax=Dryococelus australis TaxID=614101 RepID=A0ABQ9HNI0_9NEOP|nr:hypothetical protein PR048_012119 [Dryococelus australis]
MYKCQQRNASVMKIIFVADDEVVELRSICDQASENLPEHQKRESIDRVPHRPAPPAPVLSQQGNCECIEQIVHSDASGKLMVSFRITNVTYSYHNNISRTL